MLEAAAISSMVVFRKPYLVKIFLASSTICALTSDLTTTMRIRITGFPKLVTLVALGNFLEN